MPASGQEPLVLVACIYGVTNLLGTVYAARRANAARVQAKGARTVAEEVSASVGPSNGKNITQTLNANTELLTHLTALSDYQHKRNHDILNALAANALRLHLLSLKIGVPTQEPTPPEVAPDW